MNLRSFYLYKFFTHFVLIYPVYLLLFSDKGLSLSAISLMLMIWSVPVVLLEIPSGILADIWSRKKLVLISSVLHALCFAIWIFSDGFALFVLGFIFWGISESMVSGALEALLFDSLKSKGQSDQFDTIYSRGETIANVGLALAMVLGGAFAQFMGFSFVLICSVISILIAGVLAFTFKEINLDRHRLDKKASAMKNGLTTFKDSFRFLFHAKLIFWPVLLSILVFGVHAVLDEYDQAVAAFFVPSILWVGIWGSVRFIFEGLGAFLAPKVKRALIKKNNPVPLVIGVCMCASMAMIVFSILRSPIAIIFYALYFVSMSSMHVLIEDYIQQKIENAGRSTVHSIVSLLLNLYAVLLFMVFSGLLSRFSMFIILLVAAVYSMVMSIIIGLRIKCLNQKAIS